MDLNYTLFTLGNVQLHLLHTPKGNFFVAAEVVQRLFRESIVVFQKVCSVPEPNNRLFCACSNLCSCSRGEAIANHISLSRTQSTTSILRNATIRIASAYANHIIS